MGMDNIVSGETARASSSAVNEISDKMKELQEQRSKIRKQISVAIGLLFVRAFVITRKKRRRLETFKEDRRRIMPHNGSEENVVDKKLKDGELQSEETFKEGMELMTEKSSKKYSAEISALSGSIQKQDQQGKGISNLKSVSSGQGEIETQKSDNDTTNSQVERAIRMMRVLHGSNSDDRDFEIFRNLKSYDYHLHEFLCSSGAIGLMRATEEGGKETDIGSVIQSLAKRLVKDYKPMFFGSDIDYDPSEDLMTRKIFERMEYYFCELFRLYLAEESEKDKMENNGADQKRRMMENIADCDVKSNLAKEEEGKSEA